MLVYIVIRNNITTVIVGVHEYIDVMYKRTYISSYNFS